MTYLLLVYEFFMTGLLAVGGGKATVPFLVRMSQSHPDWFSLTDLANMIAVSESTPGPIGINMASYVGYNVGGVLGSVLAPVALVFPSVVIIIVIAKALEKYMENTLVKRAFSSLRAAVVGLMAAAGWTVLKTAVFYDGTVSLASLSDFFSSFNIAAVILFVCAFVFTQIKPLKKLHPIVYIAVGAAAGVIFKL